MKLTHEFNEYVVGLVVTDEETGRSVNFQYEKYNSNHPEPNYYLSHSCEGDETHKEFTQEELEIISEYVSALPNSEKLEDEMTAIMYSDLAEKMRDMLADQGCLYYSDITEIYDEINE